ncbi:MAG: DUF4397 domain-containing protein [Acidobacteriota bacterium]
MAWNSLHSGKRYAPLWGGLEELRSAWRRAGWRPLLGLAAAVLTGCQGMAMYSSLDSAQLRVIDASPDAGIIDSYGNDEALAYNLSFGTMTSYIALTPGDYQLTAARAGTHQTLAAGSESLAAGKQYTEIIGAGLADMRQAVFVDRSKPAPEGEIAVRVINATTRLGALSVSMAPMASADSRAMSSSSLATHLGPGVSSGYVILPMGTYAIDVASADTSLSSSTAKLLSGVQIPYPSGAVRTVVLIDQPSAGDQPSSSQPRVQAIVADDADAP